MFPIRRSNLITRSSYKLLVFFSIILFIPLFIPRFSSSSQSVYAATKKITITGSKCVAKGKSIRLTADQPVTWKSSNPTIAKVYKKGKVKGLRPGKAVIIATSKENPSVRKRIKIKVYKKAVKRITLSVKTLNLDVTKAPIAEVTAKATPKKAAQKFEWSSSAPKIAAVSSSGVVKALQAGTARITCQAMDGSKKKAIFAVTVTDKVKEEKERKKKEEEERKKKEAAYWNILLVGNSFAQDEFGYVPALLKEFFPSLKFRIGLLFTGGASLELHYNNLNGNGAYQQYSEYTSESTKWTHQQSVRLSDVISKYAWKIVTFQQASAYQGDYATMKPYIKKLMDGYTKKMGRTPVYLYVFPHIRGSKNEQITKLNPATTAAAYQKYVAIVQTVLKSFSFKGVIPNATAIENARTVASLNTLGSGGDMTYDTWHLQDGLPCLVANYCSFLRLLPFMGLSQPDLTKSRILPTKTWIAAQSVPGADNNAVGVTEANRLLAVKCALKAVQAPYAITKIQ